MSFKLERIKTRFTFDYTLHDGPLKGKDYSIGLTWSREEERNQAAKEFADEARAGGRKMSISNRRLEQTWL